MTNVSTASIVPELKPNRQAILEHLQFLFANPGEYQDGKIEIAFTPTNSGAVNKAEWFDILDLEQAADFAAKTNATAGVNVYVGAAIRSPNTAPFGRSKAEDYYAATAIWCDLDDPGAAATAKDIYKRLPPSVVVVTGRHPDLRAQAWWHLMLPETDPTALRANLAHIQAVLNGDPAVVDPARVMRLAGTIAWPKKDGRQPELTELHRPASPTMGVLSERFTSYFPGSAAPAPLLTQAPAPAGGVSIATGKPINRFTGTLEIAALLEATKQEGHWHVNMRDAIASMVGKGWTDEQIRITTNPYRRDNSLKTDMISPLIASARQKWDVADPALNIKPEQYDPVTGEIKARRLPLLYADDITPNLEAKDFVEDVLREREFSVIYGESNCGKTFFMMDLAMHVALGRSWRGKVVDQGGVIYAALEGGHGTINRIVAFKQHYNINNNIPLAVIPSSLNFMDRNGDIMALIEAIKEAQARIGHTKLIVIDTLARAISGGDENSGQDMGAMVINADLIREATGAHIAFIHHSGKDALKGARGHSSLRAAVDTEIEIKRESTDAPSAIRIVKQREMEMIDDMAFTLERVVLGQNKRLKEVSSCVVIPSEVIEDKKVAKMTPHEKFVYDALVMALIDYGQKRRIVGGDSKPVQTVTFTEFGDVLQNMGYKHLQTEDEEDRSQFITRIKSATNSVRLSLKDKGYVNMNKAYLWLVGNEELNFYNDDLHP